MCDRSETSCSPTNTVRSRAETERSDEPQVAGHRLGANATADHSGQRSQGPLRAALAATFERTESVLETRSAEELHLPWQDERRSAVGGNDPADMQDGSRTGSYQEGGYPPYPEAFFRDRPTRSRSRSDGYQQAVRTQQLYNYHDLFALPQGAFGFNAERFVRQLKSLHRRGKLELGGAVIELADPKGWRIFIDSLLEKNWCVFIEPPPTNDSTPEQVLKYLARYMTGGPISDQRLVSCENGIVTFKARPGDKQKSRLQIDVRLSGVEFVREWAQHILPKGFTKSRGFGGYSSRNRTAFIALCQQLKPPPLNPAKEGKESSQADDDQLATEETRCPICLSCQLRDGREQPMVLTGSTFRPSWRDLFYGPDQPQWFES